MKVGIGDELFAMLSALPRDGRHLLPGLAKRYLNGGNVSCDIQKFFRANGVETYADETGDGTGRRAVVEYGFHSLRYSYISRHAELGTPAAVIQRNAGHSNPAMTEHYMRISDEAALKYASRLTLNGDGEASRLREQLAKWSTGASVEQLRMVLRFIAKIKS